MKAEDKFYFGKPGQKATMGKLSGLTDATLQSEANRLLRLWHHTKSGESGLQPSTVRYRILELVEEMQSRNMTDPKLNAILKTTTFSRPGQPERFAISSADLNYAKSQIRSASPERLREIEKELLPLAKSGDSNAKTLLDYLKQEWDERYRSTYSRPGQPERFDASSLDRGNFAEASTSPMLGNLLSEKVMPEGGWRAVETGGGALVISFEDADLARDFGRRAASKGYNATSPVQAIGRYWNVEVKNG